MLLLFSLFCGPLVDDTLGLALGALDGMRFHEAHLGGDAQEFLDALLDGAFQALQLADLVGKEGLVHLHLDFQGI